MQLILVSIYILLSTGGLVLVKLGGNSGTLGISNCTLNFNVNLISAIGLICYICSFLLFTKIISTYDLSYILPICTGVVQVLSLVAAYFIFKERINIYGFIGIASIIAGIILLNIKK